MKHLLTTLILCLFLTACAPVEHTETVQIGGLFAFTGYGAQWGAAERNAAQLAINEANAAGGIDGKQLVLVAEDTQTDPQHAVLAYRKLIEQDNVQIVIGPTWEASAAAIAPLAISDQVLLVSPSSYSTISESGSSTLFSTYPPFEFQFEPLIEYASSNNITQFGVVYNDELYSVLMESLFEKQAADNAWNVTGEYRMPLDNLDYRVQLLKIKQSGAQAIYAPMEADQLGRLMTQAKELGLTLPIYSIDSIEGDSTFHSFGTATEGVLYPSAVKSEEYAVFEKKYLAAYGKAPDAPSAANAYDAMSLVIEAMRSGAKTPTEISSNMHAHETYNGAAGETSFNTNGIIEHREYTLKTVREGTFVEY